MAPVNNRLRALKLTKAIKDSIIHYKSEIQKLDGSHNSQEGLFQYLKQRNPRITYADVARWIKRHRWITEVQIEIVSVEGSVQAPNERVIEEDGVESPHFPPPNQNYVIHGMDYESRVLGQEPADDQQNFQNNPPPAIHRVLRHDNFNRNRNHVQFLGNLQASTPESPFHPNPPSTVQQNKDRPSSVQHNQSILPHQDHQDQLFSVFFDSGVPDVTDGSPNGSETSPPDQQALLKNCFLRMKRLQGYTRRFHRKHSLKKLERKATYLLALTYGFAPGESEHSAALRLVKQECFQDP